MRHDQTARSAPSTPDLRLPTITTGSLSRPVIAVGLVLAALAAVARLGPLTAASRVADTLAIGTGLLLALLGAIHAVIVHVAGTRADRQATARRTTFATPLDATPPSGAPQPPAARPARTEVRHP